MPFKPTPRALLELMSGLDLIGSNSIINCYLQKSLPTAAFSLTDESSDAGIWRQALSRSRYHSSIQTSLQIRACGDFVGCLAVIFLLLDTTSARDEPQLDRLESILKCVVRVHLLISERLCECLRRSRKSIAVRGLILLLSLLQPYECDSDALKTLQFSTLDMSSSLRKILKLCIEIYTIAGNLESMSFNSALRLISAFSIEVGCCSMRCVAWLYRSSWKSTKLVYDKIRNIASKDIQIHLIILLQHLVDSDMGSLHRLYPQYLQLSIYRAELRNRFLNDHDCADLELLLCREVFQYLLLFVRNAVGSRSVTDPEVQNLAQSTIAEVS